MPPKKNNVKDVVLKTTTKSNLPLYFDRYREIEIYLRLLQESRLVGNLLQTVPVGANAAVDRVEQELKAFLEHKFQLLTGLIQETEAGSLNKDELLALKLLANKVMPKAQVPVVEQVTSNLALQETLVSENEEEKVVEEDNSEENDDDESLVSVENISGDAILKKREKEAKKIVKETSVPTIEGPTDRMKRSRPKGASPRPKASPQEEMAMAAMAAQAASAAFAGLSDGRAQMVAPVQTSPSMTGDAALNLDDNFSMYR